MVIRSLTEKHRKDVNLMDEVSGNYVAQWLDDDSYAYGIFDDQDRLAGYCTIGGADDVPECIENHPSWTNESYLLSDVYVLPQYRHQRYGTNLVNGAIRIKEQKDGREPIFITLLYDALETFYEKIGFEWVDENREYAMVRR